MSEHDSRRDDISWMEMLAAFRHGERMLPCLWPAGGDAPIRVSARVDSPSPPDEALCVAALALVALRCNGGSPVLVAVRPASGDAALPVFVRVDNEDGDAASFVARVRADWDAARRQPPCRLDRVSGGLGVSDGAFLQLGVSSGGAPEFGARAAIWLDAVGGALDFRFDASTYSRAFAAQVAAQTARAVAWLVAAGPRPLAELTLLSEEDAAAIARWSSGPRVERPAGLTLHGLVEAQARRTPDAKAVVHKGVTLSYGQLDARANRVADSLRRRYGVKAGDAVGVMVSRSDSTPVALLGVMKAGAAYVPINPRHPWETVSYMTANAGISVLIVDADSIAAAAMFGGQFVVVDIELRGEAAVEAPSVALPDDALAYVIYTSGSTGKPKGVAVEHRAAANTILWRNAFYGIGPADVNLQIPSFAFDSSVVDIFCVLSAGGALVVPEEDLRLDVAYLKTLSAAHGVTSCIVTPSYYRRLVGELRDAVPTMRCVTLAGETATPDLVAAHLEHLGGVALFNEYGPTENAVCSTACRLDAVEPSVSIGPPIDNVDLFILDASGRVCPAGVAGEIFLGGVGLARGYFNQPALTAERFVPAPGALAERYTGLLYRTGDRACWRPDGAVEFLGRLDSQVKVRGFRIELDEVELALRQHVAVRNAAVLCKDDPGGTNYLAAYADGESGLGADELRDHLRGRLPYYMVPDVLTVLPQLPLNLNGKVDRGVLRAVDDFAGAGSAPDAEMSPIEAGLLSLTAGVLHRVNMTLDDNFFDLGGNSLAVMELTSRIRGELSLEVDLIDIYTFPTIRELAGHLSGATLET